MGSAEKIIKHARHCFLPKLSRNVEEIDNHLEYYDCKTINLHFPLLLNAITKDDLRKHPEFNTSILPTIMLLYLERSANTPWNNETCVEYAQKLNKNFQTVYKLPLEIIFTNCDFCEIQEVFNSIVVELNLKATSQDFKKYPGLLIAYYVLMNNLKVIKTSSLFLIHRISSSGIVV